ncbi:hypothetical protein [Pedobacter sp. Leaf170]|uniref:hypothetical protein n=1 Tax=Pedobacter sp. Leaf170 TaxID=2876558 RepID=UPI001E4A3B89|nr:hypothetical protein [Pedobacter sp. Leaf170]
MSKDTFIDNLYRAATNMFSQFNTEEPLISEEASIMLSNAQTKEEIFEKILKKPTKGEVTLKHNGEDVVFFVEA